MRARARRALLAGTRAHQPDHAVLAPSASTNQMRASQAARTAWPGRLTPPLLVLCRPLAWTVLLENIKQVSASRAALIAPLEVRIQLQEAQIHQPVCLALQVPSRVPTVLQYVSHVRKASFPHLELQLAVFVYSGSISPQPVKGHA